MRKKKQQVQTTRPEPVYSFPTRSRCPRCGAPDTKATSTQGEIQYRECIRPVCRHTFKVQGSRI